MGTLGINFIKVSNLDGTDGLDVILNTDNILINGNIGISSLISCEGIQTDANGVMSCSSNSGLSLSELNLKVTDLSSLDTSIATSLGSLMKNFLGEVGNNVTDLYASVIHSDKVETKMLCVGTTCVTESEFLEIVNKNVTDPTPPCESPNIINADGVCTAPEEETGPDITALTDAKGIAQGLINDNDPESTTVGDHVEGSLDILIAANAAADATVADTQDVIDGQVTVLLAAIDAYNAAIVQ